jgi:glucose/mannose-6-phosphate isomerase
MRVYIENFTGQLKEALSISENIHFGFQKQDIQNIVIAGLGGSGIGGSIVKDLVFASCPIPITSCKDYNLPHFVNKNTLVICNSYSGNTEETLEAYAQAKKKGALIFCISTGGRLIEIAKADNFPFITFPGGNPPRACLAYSLVQVLVLLEKLGLHSLNISREINESISNLEAQSKTIEAEALPLAKKLFGKIPALYALDGNDCKRMPKFYVGIILFLR